MSQSLVRLFAGAVAATTAGLLMWVAPAQAAPAASGADGQSNVAAANAAVVESLPPNVTMTVIGKLPQLNGPMDHYVQDGPTTTTGVSPFAATLPYSFTFTAVRDLYGRTFRSTKSSVCTDIQVWEYQWGEDTDFRVSLQGSSVKVPYDNVARSYCWSGVAINKDLQFRYYFADECGECALRKVNGKGQVRYP